MKKIIVTVGPALLTGDRLKRIHDENHIYRINGAHGTILNIDENVDILREAIPEAEILIDLPGNKIRTENLETPLILQKGREFKLKTSQVNYKNTHKCMKKDDVVFADDSTLTFTVQNIDEHEITFLSQSEGKLANNKGLHVRGINQQLPFLFPKDMGLIKLVNRRKVTYVGLSFVRNAKDIEMAQKHLTPGINVIAKVETKSAVENVNSILEIVDSILIDRGDLSTEVGLEKIPLYQRFIIEKALFFNKRVYLATQFLKNMVENPVPTIAEIIDLYHTFKQGIHGIQLSEETAVGRYPEECLAVIRNVMEEIKGEMH
ncbi:MAG: pyruvate kinase [bacterium]|nr:pyruvate kinase [bacterium]